MESVDYCASQPDIHQLEEQVKKLDVPKPVGLLNHKWVPDSHVGQPVLHQIVNGSLAIGNMAQPDDYWVITMSMVRLALWW